VTALFKLGSKRQITNNKSQKVGSESSSVNDRGSTIKISVVTALLLYVQEYNLAPTAVAVLSQQGNQESEIVKILFLSPHLASTSEYLSQQSKLAKSQARISQNKVAI